MSTSSMRDWLALSMAALAALLILSVTTWWALPSATAHHSFAAFDMRRTYQITGTVTSYEWTNPHTWVRLNVTGSDGQSVLWSIESGAPNINVRLGWKSTDIKHGDTVTVAFHPLQSGELGGTLAYVVLADGRLRTGNGGGFGVPSADAARAGKVDIKALLAPVPVAPGMKGATATNSTGQTSTQSPTPTAATPTPPAPAAGAQVPAFLRPYLNPVPPGYPQPSTDPRDLEGTWVNTKLARWDISQLPYQPATRKEMERRQAAMKAGHPIGGLSDICRQPGLANELALNFPFTILQSKDQLLIVQEEYHSTIRVHMNQPLPEHVPVTYAGYSVGRWEGDTLVIETRGLDPRGTLGPTAATHSEALHVTLRIRKIDGGRQLELAFTFDDPKAYTAPWSPPPIAVSWRPDYAHFSEYNCEETSGSAAAAAAYGIKVDP